MKLKVIDGKVMGVPESDKELEVLINLSRGTTPGGTSNRIERHGLPHRCIAEGCERILVGKKGLAVHVRANHKQLYTKANFPLIGGYASSKSSDNRIV